jgi:glutamate synthase domain-containing protein 3
MLENTEIDQKLLLKSKREGNIVKVNAENLYYRELNALLREIIKDKTVEKIEVTNVYGQRYIGTNLDTTIPIDIHGITGNDLGAFMNGPKLTVYGHAQDASGNTMNEGQIVIHGHAGDLTGNSMRGGRMFVRDNVGYRVGIHMKEYENKVPTIVIGQTAGDFLAEYMAGGIIVILGLNLKESEKCKARFVGTGMHGGVIYERGEILSPEEGTKTEDADEKDMQIIESLVKEYANFFDVDLKKILEGKFKRIKPLSSRPYAKLYSH